MVVWRGVILILQRLGAVALCLAALMAWPRQGLGVALLWFGLAVAVYVALGRCRAVTDGPRDGPLFRYDRISAVILPDALGIGLAALFAVIPFWVARDGLHPSAYLLWPMAALALSLPIIGARRDGFTMRITADTVELHRIGGFQRIPFGQIAAITPVRRDLPGWMRALVPVLVALGRPGPAGTILLARPSRGLSMHLRDGRRVTIPCDGLEAGCRGLLEAALAHGIAAPAM